MKSASSLLLASSMVFWPLLSQAQKAEAPQSKGTYYSAQRPSAPPFPFNPFPELPKVEVEPKRFVYDDTKVDYEAMQAQSASMAAPSPPGGGGGGTNPPPYLPPTAPIPGVPLLKIETFDGVNIITYNTITGLVYRLEYTTNLSNPQWVTLEELVATGEQEDYTIDDEAQESRFYRAYQEDDLIQFPDWFDSVWQYLRFDVYTPVTNGVYTMALFADDALVFTNGNTIPASGRFFVHDPAYDPADWPNTGYYGVGEWELRVTVTSAAGAGGGGARRPAGMSGNKASRGTRRALTRAWLSSSGEFSATRQTNRRMLIDSSGFT